MCDDAQRLHTNDIHANSGFARGFMTEEMKAAANETSEEDEEDQPYCVHEDYPCKGDDDYMVHVCYYSSHSGYQTFCIPEMDSDVLRFNKKHHCGPCKGWSGAERTVQMM